MLWKINFINDSITINGKVTLEHLSTQINCAPAQSNLEKDVLIFKNLLNVMISFIAHHISEQSL